MQPRDFLFEMLGQQMNIILVSPGLVAILQEAKLSQQMIREKHGLTEDGRITPCPSGNSNLSTCNLMF